MNTSESGDANRETVFEFIRNFIQDCGRSPSQREIARGTFMSQSTVRYHMDILEQQKRIERKRGRAGTIRIAGEPWPTGKRTIAPLPPVVVKPVFVPREHTNPRITKTYTVASDNPRELLRQLRYRLAIGETLVFGSAQIKRTECNLHVKRNGEEKNFPTRSYEVACQSVVAWLCDEMEQAS